MHVGNLRTALYAFLKAKSAGGTVILRIEDTDQERYVEGAVDIIYKTPVSYTHLLRPDTLYFGGGTPSLLTPAQAARLIRAAGPVPGAEHRIFRMHRPDQCLLFDDALAVFTLRVNVRVVIKYRDPEVIA